MFDYIYSKTRNLNHDRFMTSLTRLETKHYNIQSGKNHWHKLSFHKKKTFTTVELRSQDTE